MRKPNTAKAAPEATDLRQRAARARDAAGRFDKRTGPVPAAEVAPDPALAVSTAFRASWDGLNHALEAEGPGELVADLEGALGASYDRLRAVRPTTPEGFRALAECWAIVLKGHRGDEPGQTASEHAADSLIAGAGVCLPTIPDTDSGDPALALIEAHRAAYALWEPLAAAQNCARVGSPEYIAACDAEKGPGKAEIAAYDALFSARPSTLAGTLALAEYLQRAVRRAQIEPEPDDGERALAAVVAALRATAGLPRRHLAPGFVGMLDLSSASLEDLQALHDTADLVGGVAYAVCWQSRCRARVWDEHGMPGEQYNAAGKLMQWLGDALTDVETAANDEARRRSPTTNNDRETRLEMLALPVIQNGDRDEINTLARELLEHAAAGRKGH